MFRFCNRLDAPEIQRSDCNTRKAVRTVKKRQRKEATAKAKSRWSNRLVDSRLSMLSDSNDTSNSTAKAANEETRSGHAFAKTT